MLLLLLLLVFYYIVIVFWLFLHFNSVSFTINSIPPYSFSQSSSRSYRHTVEPKANPQLTKRLRLLKRPPLRLAGCFSRPLHSWVLPARHTGGWQSSGRMRMSSSPQCGTENAGHLTRIPRSSAESFCSEYVLQIKRRNCHINIIL